jgi:hypothetical protein
MKIILSGIFTEDAESLFVIGGVTHSRIFYPIWVNAIRNLALIVSTISEIMSQPIADGRPPKSKQQTVVHPIGASHVNNRTYRKSTHH